VLDRGFVWRMGDGKQIRIWEDRWIPTPSTYQVQSPLCGMPRDALASSLIDPTTGGWNVALIRPSFQVAKADVISNLVPSPLGNADKRVWIASLNGCFNVKSAYHSEMTRRSQARGGRLRLFKQQGNMASYMES
jgi:hypothetical protein